MGVIKYVDVYINYTGAYQVYYQGELFMQNGELVGVEYIPKGFAIDLVHTFFLDHDRRHDAKLVPAIIEELAHRYDLHFLSVSVLYDNKRYKYYRKDILK